MTDSAENPGEIANRPFGFAFRGFDKAEVRNFLSQIAAQQQALTERASQAEARVEDLRNQLGSIEELLKRADEKYEAAQAHLADMEAEREVAANRPPPDPKLDAVKAFGERVTEVLQIAVAAGDSIRAEAEAWATQKRDQAAQDAADTVACARREVAEIVAREETNVDQLRSTEQALRSWLQAAHSAIGQVLERPSVGPGELAAVLGQIRELGPSTQTTQVADSGLGDSPTEPDQDKEELSAEDTPGPSTADLLSPDVLIS